MGSFLRSGFLGLKCRTAAAALCIAMPSMMLAGTANSYVVRNLVANVPGVADVTDPNLNDPWGISASATSPFWVSNHLTGNSTLYNGSGAITAVVVTIPPAAGKTAGKPTGQVRGGVAGKFLLPTGVVSSFIFATEDGTISAWQAGTVATVMVDYAVVGTVYKGLAINPNATAPLLYAANFSFGKIDVFDGAFKQVTVPGNFINPAIPAGFAPFNIWNLGGKLYVAYAKQNAARTLDVAGAGNGYVAVFDLDGNLISNLVAGGALNSPWGLAIAPANWGAFPGALLVGNFGDGAINAYNATTGAFLGAVLDNAGKAIVLPGLWALQLGNGGTGGDPNTIYFAAGVPNGSTTPRGILGSIAPAAEIFAVYNAAGYQTSAIAPGEVVNIAGQTVGATPAVRGVIPVTGNLGTALGTGLGATSVTINGIAAPILYTSSTQTSVVVPYGVAGSGTASVVMKSGSQTTAAFSIPVAATVPGVFTQNGGGTGQAVVLNADGTVNSTTNPAARGTVFLAFVTGEGTTNPPGQDGLVLPSTILRSPVLPVSVSVGGQPSPVLYAGGAPGGLSGVMEVEGIVPAAATVGNNTVLVTVGTVGSQGNVTIAVK